MRVDRHEPTEKEWGQNNRGCLKEYLIGKDERIRVI